MIKGFIIRFFDTIVSLIRCFFYSSLHNKFGYNNESQDKTCIVLANGPSLNAKVDLLSPTDKDVYFSVNFFALSDHFFRLKPNYYVFADSAFWDKEEKLHQETIEQRAELIKRFQKVDWRMTIFLPGKGAKSKVINYLKENNHNLRFISYNTTSFKGFESIKKMTYKKNYCMPISQNVLIAALYLAINLGYKNINIYGGDFSWTKSIRVNKNNVVCQIDSHFYDEKDNIKLAPVLGYVGKPYRMHHYLGDLAKMFEGCWQVKYYADCFGVRIVNKNPDSFIDAFNKE